MDINRYREKRPGKVKVDGVALAISSTECRLVMIGLYKMLLEANAQRHGRPDQARIKCARKRPLRSVDFKKYPYFEKEQGEDKEINMI